MSVALRLLIGIEISRLMASLGQPGRGWAQNPAVSAAELTAAIAAELVVDLPAVQLFLQLPALPDPTDKNILRWNDWRRRQLQASTTTLITAGVAVEDKRRKTGRTVFLIGGRSNTDHFLSVVQAPVLVLFPSSGPALPKLPTIPVGESFRWPGISPTDGATWSGSSPDPAGPRTATGTGVVGPAPEVPGPGVTGLRQVEP